ncbi:MAG: peptidylprolyl isomerase [Ruminococcus sp.]|nr:peptidylprolyl isomerase [Ruminococcus sp.]MCD7801156.1 peptidylprolyl isomerase [Ruminococcus sp.]
MSKKEYQPRNKMNKRLRNMFKVMCIALVVAALLYLINTIFLTSSSTKIDMQDVQLTQLDALEGNINEGDPIAIITTNLGEIRAVLYPEEAPNTVQSFIDLAESGYYDNSYVFRVQEDTYFAGGSYDREGNLNEDTFSEEAETIKQEVTSNLWPFKGAFCSLSSKSNCSGSRFMVLNSITFDEETTSELLAIDEDTRLADAFIEYGGIPNFSQQMTIFAQTYQGFDVIDKICSQEVEDEDTLIPSGDIIIEKIEISTYHKDDSIGDSGK